MIDSKLLKALMKGSITFIPGVVPYITAHSPNSHSGSSAQFCYSFWLTILSYFREKNIPLCLDSVGEIGTGGSMGMGICALLTGAAKYYAFDIEEHYEYDFQNRLLDEIVNLFMIKKSIPSKIPKTNISINKSIPIEELIGNRYLDTKFIAEIREALNNKDSSSKLIRRLCTFEERTSYNIDFLFSRAVMEHVNDPKLLYHSIPYHLKMGAFILHDIEFHSHDITSYPKRIDQISPKLWRIIYGKRKYFLNRWNLEMHVNAIEKEGFKLLEVQESYINHNKLCKSELYGATIIAKYDRVY